MRPLPTGKDTTFIFSILLTLCAAPLHSQNVSDHVWSETGLSFIHNYAPKEYGGDFQNWCVARDKRGIIYVANNFGLLEFDGANWRMTQVDGILRSVAVSNSNQVFGGTETDFGYFSPDTTGSLQFHSLKSLLNGTPGDFDETIWYTRAVEDTIYFMSNRYLLRWTNGVLKVWRPTTSFSVMFIVRNSVYLSQSRFGLTQLLGDSLRLIPAGGEFARKPVYLMAPHGQHSILIGTYGHGLYLYDGKYAKPFISSANAFLEKNNLYCGASLPGGYTAMGTQRGGLAIMDRSGNLLQVANKETGLQDESVWFIEPDQEGGLWLALNGGIARIEMPSPLSFFTESIGLEGLVERIERHKGKLYVATSLGLYSLESAKGYDEETGAFKYSEASAVPQIREYSFALLSTGSELFVGTTNGLYRVAGGQVSKISGFYNTVFSIVQSSFNPDLLFIISREGFGLAKRINGRWQSGGWIEDVGKQISDVAEDEQGRVWVGLKPSGVASLRLLGGSDAGPDSLRARVEFFDTSRGLPNETLRIRRVRSRMLFGGKNALWSFDEEKGMFVADSMIEHGDNLSWGPFAQEDHVGRLWTSQHGKLGNEFVVVGTLQNDGKYHWTSTPFLRIQEGSNVKQIYFEEDGVAWIVSDRLYRYDPTVSKNYQSVFSALIRRVTVNHDSIIYDGHDPIPVSILPYRNNSMRFEFAAASYDDPKANRFQFTLDGYDDGWSAWTDETRKDYTGLAEGDYVFRVRGQNVYRHIGQEALFVFSILPPWYRSWWAYTFLSICGIGLVVLVVKIRIRHLKKKTRALEAIIAERTDQIEEQARRLREADRLKSRFFANISHEFRTPLTLILGPLDDLVETAKSSKEKTTLKTMKVNTARLLHLINQLLDLTRFESGKVVLKAAHGNLDEFVRGIVFSFSSLAERRSIKLDFTAEMDGVAKSLFDSDMVEKIMSNLLSNAFKFTPDGGSINVTIRPAVNRGENGYVSVSVANTGEGIPAEHLPHIFDRFFRVETKNASQGTGIGLALVRELVQLHHGTISVRSIEGQSTEFTFELPVARTHFSPAEIADTITIDKPQTDPSSFALEHSSSAPSTPTVQLPKQENSGRDVVLIVEDHTDVRQYIREQLETEYTVIEATNGRDGLEKAVEEIPDIVISDVMMPLMDGFQLCHALKSNEKTSHIPVMLLTARAAEESRIEGFETGADDYLVKPFHSKEMKVRVANLIRSREEMRKRFRDEVLVKPTDIVVTSVNADFIKRAMAIVEAHLAEESFGVQALSGELAMTPRQLHRKITALVNQTPNEFIRSFRLTRSRQMIEQEAGSIAEIAFKVGFGNPSYFSKCFREQFGVSPSEVVH